MAAKAWQPLPKLQTTRKTFSDNTGKKRKTQVISPGAFKGLQKAGLQLIAFADSLPETARVPLTSSKLDECAKTTEWSDQRPRTSYQNLVRLFMAFVAHLQQYHDLLKNSNEKAAESEDPRVQENLEDREERESQIEELLCECDAIKQSGYLPEDLLEDDFLAKLELDFA